MLKLRKTEGLFKIWDINRDEAAGHSINELNGREGQPGRIH